MSKKLLSAIICGVLCISVGVVAYYHSHGQITETEMQEASSESDGASYVDIEEKDSITVWYADETLEEFMTTSALSYQADTGVHVNLKLVSGVDYLEQINQASVYNGEENAQGEVYEQPDVYIVTHDSLMRAYLSGLATEITDPYEVVDSNYYPDVAIHAIRCNDKRVAYPLYYETGFLLYNKTYMADLASAKVEAAYDYAEGEQAQEAIDSGDTDPKQEQSDSKETDDDKDDTEDAKSPDSEELDEYEEEMSEDNPMGDEEIITSPQVLKQLSTMIPRTLSDIKAFAYNYEAPDSVEAVFSWDVSDIFYNYFFVGNYMNVGGEDGDNNGTFNIYNQQAVDCLREYQNMNNFFSIDAEESSYDRIIQDFIDGKIVFTIATTDAISRIQQAKENGEFNYSYGIAVLPDVNKYHGSRGLSVTTCAAVNGYSEKKEQANDFASYICFRKGEEVYPKADKISCLRLASYDLDEVYLVMKEYEQSIPLPKMMETSNFWVQLEIAFTQIWNGADPDETLRNLSDTIGAQIEEITYHIPFQETFSGGGATLMQ